MLNESVVKVLNESMWDLATCADGKPNVVPVAFKEIDEEGNLRIGDVFLKTTLANLKVTDGRIALSAYNPKTLEGYQVKGQATYTTEGEYVDKFKKMVETMFKGAATAKGALTIVPDEVIVTTPGADNKKVLN